MTKEELIKILDSAFDSGVPFINVMEYYSYILIPQGDKWLEVSYDFEDQKILQQHEINHEDAFFNFCEEVEKAMSAEIKDFMLIEWKKFKESFGDSEKENLIAGIKELTSNSKTYSENLPIILHKEDLDRIKSKM